MLLEVEGLEVRYGRIPAVRGISLAVAAGEVVGLVGPNGAGKSTTLGAIAGLHRASAGSVRFDGKPVLGRRPEDIVRDGLALVPEGRSIFAGLSVAENLRLGLSSRPRGTDEAAAIERVLSRFEVLRRYYRSSAGQLSGGEQQQLAIARALLCEPRLLLLDEPSLGLAPMIVDLVFETLAALRSEGVTVLLVEQKATRTIAFTDRSYVLNTGRITHSGSRRELTEEIDMGSAYLGL